MASKNGYYSMDNFAQQKRHQQQVKGVSIPPRANLVAAANHITKIFDGKKLEYGVFGGFAMLCLGSRHEQADLHIAYEDKDFQRLKMKLEVDQRIRLPEGMNPLFPAKILVRTGPTYKDAGCSQAADIEVDIVPPGSHGTPFNGTLSKNLVLLSLKTEGKSKGFKGLNIPHLVKTSIHFCGVRDINWDPRPHVLYLCRHYGRDIQSVRHLLDQRAIKQNFLGTSFFETLQESDQHLCYDVLLGTKPPPKMAITPPVLPPGHKPSASTSAIESRPQLSSHKSSPSLNVQGSQALLSPPLPGKIRPTHKRAVSAEVRPTELPASNNTAQSAPKESRSRYRPVSASSSRESSPKIYPVDPNNAGVPQIPRPSELQTIPAHSQRSHQRTSMMPQLPPNLGPMPVAHSRKSMPNLNAGYHAPLPPYAFNQTPMLNGYAPNQAQNLPHMAEMSATPIPMNPGQHHVKSQLGLAGPPVPINHAASVMPINERPQPPQARGSYQESAAFRAELSGTPMPESHINKLHLVESRGESTVSQPNIAELSCDIRQLHVVGPEGVYQAPTKFQSPQGNSFAPPAVELDASSPIGQFIAELSVDRATPAPGNFPQHNPHDQEVVHQPMQTTQDSPISPPETHAIPVQPPQQISQPLRPLDPNVQSAPATPLPSSLMAGGGHPHHRTPSMGTSPPNTTENHIDGGVSTLKTNASRYTRYYSSPAVESAPSGSGYMAYNPSASPPMASPPLVSPPVSPPQQHHPLSFAALKDVDGAGHYFSHHPNAGHGHGHKRDHSRDSHTSGASHDSRELAEEYRAHAGL